MSSGKGKVGIVGSGLIGRSYAMLFVGAGYSVALYDVDSDRAKAALKEVETELRALQAKGLLKTELPVEEQLALLSAAPTLAQAMDGAFFVQEAVFEKLEVKSAVFKELDALATEGQILASSTSAIQPSKFTAELKHASQCIVTHPVNPPFYCPLVEVVPSPLTAPAVTEKTMWLMRELGQEPVLLKKEVYGFALNRLQFALLGEAYRLVEGGVISAADVDKVVSCGLGRRYAFIGPLETTHLNAPGIRAYNATYGDMIHKVVEDFGPNPHIGSAEMVEAVAGAMEEAVPLGRLEERRAWRDARLASLAQLHQRMDKECPF